MGNKYQESVGRWEHNLGSVTHVLEPVEDDNYRFQRLKKRSESSLDGDAFAKGMGTLYYEMVLRSESWNNEITKEGLGEDAVKELQDGLKLWISVNINQIVEDFLVAFRWTTPDKIADAKKKLVPPSEE